MRLFNLSPKTSLLAFLLSLFAALAQADAMYQCTDKNGHKTFSNIKSAQPGIKCFVLDPGQPAQTPSKPATKSSGSKASRTPTPNDFPKVDDGTQRARDGDRKNILENELAVEQTNLAEARKILAEAEQAGQNAERLQTTRNKIALHERNISAIQRELTKLR